MRDAEFVLALCDRFHCLPSQLEGEDAEVVRLMVIEAMGTKRENGMEGTDGI